MLNNLKLSFFKFSKSNLGILDLSAAFFRNEGRPVIIHLLRQMYLTGGRPTRAGIAAICSFLRTINLLKKKQGVPGVVKYLKGCHVLLQQIIAGHVLPDTGSLGPRIRRSKSGIPAIIPIHYRLAISNGDTRVIRLWATLFSTYRNMEYIGKASFSTIIDPPLTEEVDFGPFYQRFVRLFIDHSHKMESTNPFPILTASPSTESGEPSTHHWSLVRSLIKFLDPDSKKLLHALYYIMNFTNSKALLLSFSKISNWVSLNNSATAVVLPKVNNNRYRLGGVSVKVCNFLGRLHIKPEPAGKMRVFAMVDPWTQWALKGLHKYLFWQLSRHITDGTFNQLRPLSRVPFGKTQIDSLDLSAATDRLPLYVQSKLLSKIFGDEFATHWATLMVDRDFDFSKLLKDYPELSSYGRSVRYSVGQPMGALSSWAMLALTHHFLVNCAAWQAGLDSSKLFSSYAILGDDIAIWNKSVSLQYQTIMDQLGVKLGIAKSVISPDGLGIEFAKKTLYKGEDVSPFPLQEARASHDSVSSVKELQRKYNLSDLSMIRWLGYGYKVRPGSKSTAMKLFQFLKTVPTTPGELVTLFLVKSYLGPYQRDILFRKLVFFTYKELHLVANTLKRAKFELTNFRIFCISHQNFQYAIERAQNPAFEIWETVLDIDYLKTVPRIPKFFSIEKEGLMQIVTDEKEINRLRSIDKLFIGSDYDPALLDLSKKFKRVLKYQSAHEIKLKAITGDIVTSDIIIKTLCDIEALHTQVMSSICVLDPIRYEVQKSFYPISPNYYNQPGNLQKVESSVNLIFRSIDLIASMSIQSLVAPVREPSEKRNQFLGFESKATLRKWRRWILLFKKATTAGPDLDYKPLFRK